MTYIENTNSTLDTYIFRISGMHNITYIMHQMPLCMTKLFLNILGKLKNFITYFILITFLWGSLNVRLQFHRA